MKYIIIFLFFTINIFSQNIQNIKQDYNKIYSLEITKLPNDHIAYGYFTNELSDSSIFAELVNNNILLFDYIINHTQSIRDSVSAILKDTINYKKHFSDILIQSSELDSNIFPIVNEYFISKKMFDGKRLFDKKEYSKNEIMNIAVRFFYPSSIFNNDLQAHVCVVINGLDDYPKKRDIILEGFIFQTIFTNLDNEKYKIREDFTQAKQKAKELDLSKSEDVLLKRTQGVVWSEMYESKSLWEAIVNEYKTKKDILPFIIKDI